MSVKPLIVILCLNHSVWFDVHNADLLSQLSQKDVIHKLAKTPSQAHRYLTSTTRPHAVILADGGVTEPEHYDLHARLVQYATDGGTVIYARPFNPLALWPDPDTMFQDVWGLPWRVFESSTDGGSHTVNPFFHSFNTDGIVRRYPFSTVHHIYKVALKDAVYIAPSLVNKLTNAPPAPTETCKTPAAFARVGRGRVGYIGEREHFIEGRDPRTDLIFAMCFWPGSGAPVAPGGVSSASVPPVRQRGPYLREAEVAVLAEARKKVLEGKRKRADALKNEGNELFKQEKWEDAAEKYRAAALLAGPQPVYLANLAACALKLELWEFVDSAATRALAYDPKYVKALYRRALARKELGRVNAALADIEWLLTIDKMNAPAIEEKSILREGLDILGSLYWLEDTSVGSKRDHAAMNIEDEPDSEEFAHQGTGIACKDYNTSDTGCLNGKACCYSHAPDSKSVRDELGRNVCVYWLFGDCRFTEAGECVYTHDATYLPGRGWWTDTARLERIRAEFDDAVKEEPLDLGAGPVEEGILAEAFVPRLWRKDLWVFGVYEDEYGGSDEDSEGDYDHSSDYDDASDDNEDVDEAEHADADSEDDYDFSYDNEYVLEDEEERRELNEFGVTNADVEEMWEYGIKPWEDGAYEEMLRIRRILSQL